MENNNKVYLNLNERKGIYAISFFNPVLKKRTTKSLGTQIGMDKEKAEGIQEEVSNIINDVKLQNYEGYKIAKEKFSEDAIKAVYEKTKFKKQEFIERVNKFSEDYIKIVDEDTGKFKKEAVMYIGDPGVGKTRTIQQKIGSAEYNTPASTLSNTTTGVFIADINNSANELEMLVQESDDVEQISSERENIYSLLRYLVNNKDKIDKEECLNKLLISDDLRFNLTYLNSNIELFRELSEQIQSDFESIYSAFNNNKEELMLAINDIIIVLDGGEKEDCKYKFTDEQIQVIKLFIVDNYVQQIQNLINKEKIKVIKNLFKICKESVENSTDLEIIIKYVDNKKKDEIELKSGVISDFDISEKIIVNIKAMYISMKYANKKPDEELKDVFFKVMQRISCVDKEIKSIVPLVEKMKIRGNFKSKVAKSNDIANYILIDSEGIGHNAGNLESGEGFIRNLQMSNRVIWMLDINRPVTSITKETLKLLASNGSLYKTAVAFTKCDEALEKNEDLDQRIYKIKENLKKEFNGDTDNLGIFNSNVLDNSNILLLGDMDKRIEEDKVFIRYRGKAIEDTMEEMFIENFNRLEDFQERSDLSKKIYLEYSLIELAKVLDKEVESFIKKFSSTVYELHWKIVEAFTDRIGYNYNGRKYRMLMPEADIRQNLKINIEKIISKPINYSEEERKQLYDDFQMIQEKVSQNIDEIVAELIFKNNQEIWKELYKLSGQGTGNKRKRRTAELVKQSVTFDRQQGRENEILKRIVNTIEKLNSDGFDNVNIKIKSFI